MKLFTDIMRKRAEKPPKYPKDYKMSAEEEKEAKKNSAARKCAEILFNFFSAPPRRRGSSGLWEAPKATHTRSKKVRKIRRQAHATRMSQIHR